MAELRSLEGGKRADMYTWDPRLIVVDEEFNPRSGEDLRQNVDRLKPLIRAAGGVLEALWIYQDGDKVHLLGGHSRLKAVLELREEGFDIPVVPVRAFKAPDMATRFMYALQGNQTNPLKLWDIGTTFIRMENAGWTPSMIASKMGFEERYVKDAIDLANTPQEMKEVLASGKVSTGRVLSEVRKKGGTAADAVERVKQAVESSGGKQVKREKTPAVATSAPVTPWEVVGRDILAEVRQEIDGVGDGPYMSVSTSLIRRLLDCEA